MDYYAATFHPSTINYKVEPLAPIPNPSAPPANYASYVFDDTFSNDNSAENKTPPPPPTVELHFNLDDQYIEAAPVNNQKYNYNYEVEEEDHSPPARKRSLAKSKDKAAAYTKSAPEYKYNYEKSSTTTPPQPQIAIPQQPPQPPSSAPPNQQILDLPKNTVDEQLIRYEKLTALSTDFLYAAKLYGKIIISEYNIPNHKKSIRPVQVGGTAGGEKYIHGGILFKFATDWKDIYRGDEFAMKAANHELKGLNRYFAVCHESGLRVPLFVLIDYLGFRLIAQSLVPINFKTLVYGSADAGTTVYTVDSNANQIMQNAGAVMNLKGHFTGQPNALKFLHAPIDIEVHKGTDGRYYLIGVFIAVVGIIVLDAARAFPPTAPVPGVKSCYLYKLFRPEFLKQYKTALDPDACSPFDKFNPERTKNREEITEATEYLLNEVVPQFCSSAKITRQTKPSQLIDKLHQAGINVRYLGLVRKHAQSLALKKLATLDIFARTIKNIFRENLRLMARTVTEQRFVPFTDVAVALFNKVMDPEFWAEEILPLANTNFGLLPGATADQIVDELHKQMEADPQYRVLKASVNGVCTFAVTGKNYVDQEWQQCYTCNLVNGKGVCMVCADTCHEGHVMSKTYSTENRTVAFYCDCHTLPALCKSKKIDSIPKLEKIQEILLYYISYPVLFKRIEQLSGVRLSRACRNELKRNKHTFVFVSTDFTKFKVTTKATNFALVAEANILHLQSLRIQAGGERLFAISETKFEQAITATPDDSESYVGYAEALKQQALKDNFDIDWKKLATAVHNYHNGDKLEAAVELVQQLSQNSDARYYVGFDQLNKLLWDYLLDPKCSQKTAQLCAKLTSYSATARRLVEPQILGLSTRFKNLKNVTLHLSQRWPEKFVTLFQNNPNLEVLDLSFCDELNDEHLEEISAHLGNLKILNISFTAVQGSAIPAILKNCPQLHSLQLANLKWKNPTQTLSELSECTRLDSLDLIGRMDLNQEKFEMLMKNRPQLKEFSCTASQLSDECFELIARKFPMFEKIQLFKMSTADKGLVSLLTNCKNLKSVDFAISPNIKDEVLAHIAGLPHLEKLSLMAASIKDSTLDAICSNCPKLTHLDLTQCTNLTPEGLKSIKKLPNLKFLSLESCDVVDELITELYSSAVSSTLILLNLSNTPITDLAIISLAQFRIVSLNVKRCMQITCDGLYQLLHDSHILQFVSFEETKLTPADIFKLTQKYPRILERSNILAAEEAQFINHWIWNQLKLFPVLNTSK